MQTHFNCRNNGTHQSRDFQFSHFLIMSKHIVEGVSQFISDLLDLQLLSVDLVLDVVNPLVQLGDVHLSVLEPPLSQLVLTLDAEDLVLQLLLSFNGLAERG